MYHLIGFMLKSRCRNHWTYRENSNSRLLADFREREALAYFLMLSCDVQADF